MQERLEINRNSNTHELFRRIVESGSAVTQPMMARKQNITLSSCNTHFQKLESAGLLQRGETIATQGSGRPSQQWSVRAEGNYFFGIVIEGGHISGCLIDLAGQSCANKRLELPHGCSQETLLAQLDTLCESMLRSARERNGKILYSFVATTGILTPDGMVAKDPNIPALNGLRPAEIVSSHFGLDCFSHSIQQARHQYYLHNCAREDTSLFIFWGYGVSIALFAGTESLFYGFPALRRRALWDFGHLCIEPGGRRCSCGRTGCLEAYVGGNAILAHSPEWNVSNLAELTTAVRNNPKIRSVIRDAAHTLGKSLFQTIELFGVNRILFYGEFADVLPEFADAFRGSIEPGLGVGEAELISVDAMTYEPGQLAHAAALFARQIWLDPDKEKMPRGLICT